MSGRGALVIVRMETDTVLLLWKLTQEECFPGLDLKRWLL